MNLILSNFSAYCSFLFFDICDLQKSHLGIIDLIPGTNNAATSFQRRLAPFLQAIAHALKAEQLQPIQLQTDSHLSQQQVDPSTSFKELLSRTMVVVHPPP